MKIVKRGTPEHSKILDQRRDGVIKQELSDDDIDSMMSAFTSGLGQSSSAFKRLIIYMRKLDSRIQVLETKN
jgi:hypothetical protein